MTRPTAAPMMQLSPTQSADNFARSRIDQRSWSWPSCATKTCARFWRVSDFPESIEEVRPPWSPVWCAGCTRGPRVLSPSPGACGVHRDRPPHPTVDRALARMLAVVPPLGRPRRPTTCRSMTSMHRLSCRRPTRFSYLELQLRPWTWTHQTKTQIERPTATSRPRLPFCRQFLPFPLRRASSRLQPQFLTRAALPSPQDTQLRSHCVRSVDKALRCIRHCGAQRHSGARAKGAAGCRPSFSRCPSESTQSCTLARAHGTRIRVPARARRRACRHRSCGRPPSFPSLRPALGARTPSPRPTVPRCATRSVGRPSVHRRGPPRRPIASGSDRH